MRESNKDNERGMNKDQVRSRLNRKFFPNAIQRMPTCKTNDDDDDDNAYDDESSVFKSFLFSNLFVLKYINLPTI